MNKIQNILKRNTKRIKLAGARSVILLALFLLPSITLAASLDEQIRDAENKLNQTQTQKKTLAGEVASFDNQIYYLQSLINATDSEIQRINNEIADTEAKIKQAEADLLVAKDKLSEIVKVSYEEGQISSLELIAKSNNFSEFVDRSEYMETMQLKIKEIASSVIKLKGELDAKKSKLNEDKVKTEQLGKSQVEQRTGIDNQRAGKNFLLAQTKGQEGAYQSLLKELYAERAAAAAAAGQTFGGSGTGGYPYTGSCGGVDPWRYYKCQCTSFGAWKWNVVYGKSWTNQNVNGFGTGNAYNWVNHAEPQGYSVSSNPRIGALAIWPVGSLTSEHYYDIYGHVAVVTSVNGGTISVEEYNFAKAETYGTRGNVAISWRNSYTGGNYSLSFIY